MATPVRNHLEWNRAVAEGWVPPMLLGSMPASPATNWVPMTEVAKHFRLDDAWTVIRGKVYNITPYLKLHPGGEAQLMKVAGKDGTVMFDALHRWVNVETIMGPCWVGMAGERPAAASVKAEPPVPLLAYAASLHSKLVSPSGLEHATLGGLDVVSIPILVEDAEELHEEKEGPPPSSPLPSPYFLKVSPTIADKTTAAHPLIDGWAGASILLEQHGGRHPIEGYIVSHPDGVGLTEVYVPHLPAGTISRGSSLRLLGPVSPAQAAQVAAGAVPVGGFTSGVTDTARIASTTAMAGRALFPMLRGLVLYDTNLHACVWPRGVMKHAQLLVLLSGGTALASVIPFLCAAGGCTAPSPDAVGIAEDGASTHVIDPASQPPLLVYFQAAESENQTAQYRLLLQLLQYLDTAPTRHTVVTTLSTPLDAFDNVECHTVTVTASTTDTSPLKHIKGIKGPLRPVEQSICLMCGSPAFLTRCDDDCRAAYYPATGFVALPI